MKHKFLSKVTALCMATINVTCFFNSSLSAFADSEEEIKNSTYMISNGALPEGDWYENLSFYRDETPKYSSKELTKATLPTSVDLSTDPCFPPLGNQGSLGSCVAFATTYYQFTYEVNKLNGVTSASDRVIYSPKWTYNSINGGYNVGTYMSNAYTLLENYGALKLVDLPYDTNYTYLAGNTLYSTDEMVDKKIEALKTRISWMGSYTLPSYGIFITSADDNDLYSVKTALNSGKVLTITTKNTFNYKTGYDANNNSLKVTYRFYTNSYTGGHAMAVVGYDDNVWCDVNKNGIAEDCEKGAFKVADSYGSPGNSYTTNGYMWVLYDALNLVSANTVNNWESSLSGTRVQGFRNETSYPTFWYITVSNRDTNFVGEIEIDTGSNALTGNQYRIGRGLTNYSSVSYYNKNMLPTNITGQYKGKILFDYSDLNTPIASYLSGYDWYVNFSQLYGSYNFRVIDDLENTISDYGASNSTSIKSVTIDTKIGDLNYDSIITNEDAVCIQYYLADISDLSTLQYTLADYNGDGTVTMADATAIIIYVAGGGN